MADVSSLIRALKKQSLTESRVTTREPEVSCRVWNISLFGKGRLRGILGEGRNRGAGFILLGEPGVSPGTSKPSPLMGEGRERVISLLLGDKGGLIETFSRLS